MVEVDVLLRGGDGDPILAHPPDTDSDITLQEWLAQMVSTNKGIKLDFKRYLNKKIVMLFAFLPLTVLQVIVNQTPQYCAQCIQKHNPYGNIAHNSQRRKPLKVFWTTNNDFFFFLIQWIRYCERNFPVWKVKCWSPSGGSFPLALLTKCSEVHSQFEPLAVWFHEWKTHLKSPWDCLERVWNELWFPDMDPFSSCLQLCLNFHVLSPFWQQITKSLINV